MSSKLLGVCSYVLGMATIALALDASSAPCNAMNQPQRYSCYQQKYAAADRLLNEVYQRLSNTLTAARKQEMRNHSRRWIAYKEVQCLEATAMRHSLEPVQARQHADYFACLANLTESRTAFLKQAFGHEGVTAGLAGTYDDCFGGRFTLRQQAPQHYIFSLEVVRGPTYHLGEVEGTVSWQGQQGRFVQTTDCGGDTPCCRLTFTQKPTLLALEEDNCHLFRGARAYFAGEYYKVK